MRLNFKGRKAPTKAGTTLNKTANRIVSAIQLSGNKSFEKIYAAIVTPRFVSTYNLGEFRHYPSKGPGCLKELLRSAVQKKLGKVAV